VLSDRFLYRPPTKEIISYNLLLKIKAGPKYDTDYAIKRYNLLHGPEQQEDGVYAAHVPIQ
jgi:hypothetical protein